MKYTIVVTVTDDAGNVPVAISLTKELPTDGIGVQNVIEALQSTQVQPAVA